MTRARALAARIGRAILFGGRRLMRGLPGLAALGCCVAGVWMLFGLGWALLAAVPFLLLLDARTR